MLDNFHMKPSNKISTYNIDFMCYTFQLDWENSILCYHYYQRLPNQIQDPISTQEQGKPTSFQDIYTLVIVKTESGGLNFSYFSFLFFLFFWFSFPFSIFGTRVRDKLTRLCGHKSHDLWKNIKGSGKNKIILHMQYM